MKFSFKFILFIFLFLKKFHNADVFQPKTYSINSEPQNLLWPHNCGLHQLSVSVREFFLPPTLGCVSVCSRPFLVPGFCSGQM